MPTRVPVQFMTLSGGFKGTDQTVEIMSQLAMGPYGARSPKIQASAVKILRAAGVQPKDYVTEMVALHNYVRDRIRYTRDVIGQETLYPPEYVMYQTQAGDCDDMSMLVAALVGSVGIPTRFKVIGQTPGSYSHVYLEAKPKDTWIPLDPIMRDKPAGWEAPASTAVISKTFPENTPDGLDTSMTRNVNGLGYHIADQRMVSHLSEDPGQAPPSPNYVQMDSMLDTDLPIESISNNQPAFPQNAHYDRVPAPTLMSRGPRLMDNTQVPAWAYARMQQDMDDQAAVENAAMAPMNGLGDLMGPNDIAAMSNMRVNGEMLSPNMQRPALAQTPEGIDTMFGRRGLVVRSDTGDRIIYHGLTALSERPPINPVRGLAGDQPGGALPGMGRLAGRNLGYLGHRGMNGPGMAALADDASGSPAPALVAAPAPTSGMSTATMGGLALLGVGVYMFLKRRRA